jgi:glycosyltransferase involved in cell wall biosynthesis
MKITYLSSPISSQYGGGEKFLDDFTNGIDAQHEFIGGSKAVFDLFQSKGYKTTLTSGIFEPVSPHNLLLVPISILVGLFQFIRFYKTFKDSDWIISPTSHCETFFVIPWIKVFLVKPVMFMIHAKPPKVFGIFPFNWLISRCWGDSPVTFVSNSQKQLWIDAGCVSSNQIVIYNGVKVSKLIKNCPYLGAGTVGDWGSKPDAKDKSDVTNPPQRILNQVQNDNFFSLDVRILNLGFIGRLNKEKGCDVLLNSLKHIRSNQNIKLTIAGEGPEKENLTTLLSKLDLPTNITVELVGFQSNPQAFYESTDLLVFPSQREGFSLVLLEAWERGLSVLTSDIKPFLEAKSFQSNIEQRLIFELDNPINLAEKIDYFVENKNEYLNGEYRLQLHKNIKNKFSVETMIGAYRSILLR